MKRCPQCNTENGDAMNFCLQCGAALPGQMTINTPNNPLPTQVYREQATGQSGNRQTFGNNQNQGFTPNFAPQQPPPQKKSNAKIFLILGGVFGLFLLFIFAGVAIVVYNVYSSAKTLANNNTTTYPTPVRTPFTSSSPGIKPTPFPSTAPTTKSATDPNGKIGRTWADLNVTEGGRTGMRIHNKFWTYNLKDTECYLAVFFQQEDGTRLASSNPAFKAPTGELALLKLLKPNFPSTVYEDIAVFIPFNEFNVAPGKHKLTADIDLLTKDGQLIQHLNFYNFEYERFAQ